MMSRNTREPLLGKLNGKSRLSPEGYPHEPEYCRLRCQRFHEKPGLCTQHDLPVCCPRGKPHHHRSKIGIVRKTATYLENAGYIVKSFNLVNPENSDSWNCLGEIGGQETMAQVFADVIIQNTGSAKGDHFWDNAEMNLLKALILYVDQGFPPEAKNIGQVYKLLTMSSEKELNSLFDLLPVSHPAKVPYCIYKQASDTVRSGVIIGLGSRLQVFQNKLIRQITSYDEINLTLPGKEKCAYFCITSDQDSTFDFLSSLFMTFVFIKLVRYADTYGKMENCRFRYISWLMSWRIREQSYRSTKRFP